MPRKDIRKTELRVVAFQVGFFLEPVLHYHIIEVPIEKKRGQNNAKRKKKR